MWIARQAEETGEDRVQGSTTETHPGAPTTIKADGHCIVVDADSVICHLGPKRRSLFSSCSKQALAKLSMGTTSQTPPFTLELMSAFLASSLDMKSH